MKKSSKRSDKWPFEWARAARSAVGYNRRDSCPVIIVKGSAMEPRRTGESYYFTTPSGKTRVHHPNAYKWPTVYWPSTRTVEVGENWRPTRSQRDEMLNDVE